MKRLVAFLGLLLSIGLAWPSVAYADVNNFTVTDFTADYYLTNDDPQGMMHVIERLNVDFTDYNHGILRAIPARYKGLPEHIKVNSITSTSGAPTKYSTYSSNGNEVLKIGDPNQTVTGAQEYTIDYQVQNVITFQDGRAQLYWDVNGDQWQQPFKTITANLHLPTGIYHWGITPKPQCFVGYFGSTTQSCSVASNDSSISVLAVGLGANQTVTLRAYFDSGYFKPATLLECVMDYALPFLEFAIMPIVAFIIGLRWWLKRGRDAKGRGTIVPQYAPPEGLSPLEAGSVADFRVDNRDITATIIDLARRGYLKIIETRHEHKLTKDTFSYSLELRNIDYSALNNDEKTLLDGIFVSKTLESTVSSILQSIKSSTQNKNEATLDDGNLSNKVVGTTVEVDALKNKLSSTAEALRNSVSAELATRGYFQADPHKYTKSGSIFVGIAFFAFLVLGQVHAGANAWKFGGGLIVGAVILWLFARAMPARTAQGVEAREYLLGLKLYMETAEKDRLEKLEGPNAAYAANAGEPVRTVELFEKLLPYAIVMGVEKQWAGKFENIYTTPPDWYSGNWAAFNVGYLTGSLGGSFNSAMNTSFSAPSSSSGGGFAGGGGGGGGGGGW